MDDVGGGAVQYLVTFADVKALVGAFASNDPNPGFANQPWIFKDDPLARLEGTGSSAIVCSYAGGWSEPTSLTTARYNRLSVELWTDPLRDASNNIVETSGVTKQRMQTLFNTVNLHLHRTNPDMVMWGDLRTVGCQLITEPQPYPIPDGDGLLRGQAYYGVSWFGSSDTIT